MHTLIEDGRLAQILLIPLTIFSFFIFSLVYAKKNKSGKFIITKQQLRSKLAAFQPEPLTTFTENFSEPLIPEGIDNNMNLCRSDYMCLAENKEITDLSVNCINKYGVGSCGPRGFYGTIDIHLDLEDKLMKFMQLEDCILYSYSLSTMSSAIYAYCKKGDMLFCDEKLAQATVQGIFPTRASITFFKHNDVQDLEEKLIAFDKSQAHKKIKARKFIIIEGIYQRTGQICPLPELMALREKYMLRMFLDESISFGSLGKNGRGVTEHFNVDRTDVDLIVGSLEYSMPTVGGFCVGSNFIIEHQRLSGLGYCFSASLPPVHSAIAIHIINLFEEKPEMFVSLRKVTQKAQEELERIPEIEVLSDQLSPKKVFAVKEIDAHTFVQNGLKLGYIFDHEEDNVISFSVNIKMDDEYIDGLMQTITKLSK